MANRMSTYSKECGSYYFRDYHGEIIFMTDEVSIMYDADDDILLKHGSPENVQKHFKTYVEKLGAVAPGMFNIQVVTSDKWKVSELNRILDTSGYIKLLKTEPERFKEDEAIPDRV